MAEKPTVRQIADLVNQMNPDCRICFKHIDTGDIMPCARNDTPVEALSPVIAWNGLRAVAQLDIYIREGEEEAPPEQPWDPKYLGDDDEPIPEFDEYIRKAQETIAQKTDKEGEEDGL